MMLVANGLSARFFARDWTVTTWHDTPIVALSSHADDKDFARGRAAGFDDYVAKFDSNALLNSLNQAMANSGDAA